ncbi:hypothetical protein [uncultured Kordia sp.]|uniref:hypothetical protein n=1 Tax=uncultured Kordia sp. TaxID=507699 RepID=UPI00261F7427|nr:hypothetical protein [uncultured Kordia sp.]
MEEQILKWKSMWKEQKVNSLNTNELIERLNKIEKKAKFQRVKLITALLVLAVASTLLLSELLANTFYLLSYILITIGIAVKLIPLYKTNYRMITDESGFNNHDFIKKLTQKMNFKTKHLLLYMFIMILALNIALLGLYEKGTIFNFEITDKNRIYYHLATIILFVIAYIINKRNMDANKKEIVSLIKDLENNNS